MKKSLFLVSMSILFAACAPVYFPNQLQTPLLQDQGEATVSASLGTSTFDMQLAYSPIKHIDLTGDFSVANGNDHEHLQFEGGMGVYQTINNALHLELLGGGGAGYSTTTTQGTFGEHNEGAFSRFYIQPNVFVVSDYIEAGLATRASFISFREFGTGVYVEPTFVGRFGIEHLKFQLQAGLSFNVNDNSVLDYNPFIFNVGLVYTFHHRSNP
ncbi:hypothetical protein ACE01N_05360 [Saccharicrinis sp. FJH2]|uniref:hypothetical protein n=1 Tax=Saccharicrinis sp. FJH65 TaxID=3344659 RepID=UPI0035F45CDF